MQTLVKTTLWVLIVMLALSGVLALGGVLYLWLHEPTSPDSKWDLPYLGWLLSLTIAEMVAIALLVARKGLGYLPATETSKTSGETEEFMSRFLGSGSSATVVSNRLSWLTSSPALKQRIIELASSGTLIEIITPSAIDVASASR